MTEGFSFAYMKELFVMALLSLVRGFKGDDFEMVDAAEAEAEAEAEKAEEVLTASSEAKVVGGDTCTPQKLCLQCSQPLPSSSATNDDTNTGGKDEVKEIAKKTKMVMPVVEIPEHLRDNHLLKVIKHQIRILHAEMDNTKEDAWPSGKMGIGGAGQHSAGRMRLGRRRC